MENSTFCTDTEIEEYIEQSMGALEDLVIESSGAQLYQDQTATQVTAAGTADYIPIDGSQNPYNIYRILGVDVLWGGYWRPVKMYEQADFLSEEETSGWNDWSEVSYNTTIGTSNGPIVATASNHRIFHFLPTPQAVHSWRVRYIPYPGDWSTLGAGNTFQGYTGWDEWIVCDAAAKCLEKEESYEQADRLIKRRDERGDQIRWAAVTMDGNDQGRIRDLAEERRIGSARRALS